MKRSKRVLLGITGSVILAACGRTPRPAQSDVPGGTWGDASPTPTPTPGSAAGGSHGHGGHGWFFSRGYSGGSSGDPASSHSTGISRGGFGSHGGHAGT